MRRGPKPAKSKEAKPSVARKSPRGNGARVRELEKSLAEALKREAEALARETATGEILRVISSSPTDAQPVFDAIVKNAVMLCGGLFSIVLRFDGEFIHFVAHHNFEPDALDAYRRWFPRRATDDHLLGGPPLDDESMTVVAVPAELR